MQMDLLFLPSWQVLPLGPETRPSLSPRRGLPRVLLRCFIGPGAFAQPRPRSGHSSHLLRVRAPPPGTPTPAPG